jgi:integrase-like protein
VPAIGIDSVGPHALRDRGDRGSLRAGDRPPHRELAAHRTVALASDVREELAGAAGGIGADQDRGAVPVGIGQLRECGVEHRDVVGGGVAARVAPSQHGGEELAGVVAQRQHWVEPERLLERRSSLLLLAARRRRARRFPAGRAGVPPITLHQVRHTHATMSLRAGVNPKIVSKRLGHATVAFTLDTYTEDVPELHHDAADMVTNLFFDDPVDET